MCSEAAKTSFLFTELIQEDFWVVFLSHLFLPQVHSATFRQLSKYFAHWQLVIHMPGLEEDPRVIGHGGASLGELTVELGLGEGWTWVLLPLLVGEVGGARHLGHKDSGSSLASSTDGLCRLRPVACPP